MGGSPENPAPTPPRGVSLRPRSPHPAPPAPPLGTRWSQLGRGAAAPGGPRAGAAAMPAARTPAAGAPTHGAQLPGPVLHPARPPPLAPAAARGRGGRGTCAERSGAGETRRALPGGWGVVHLGVLGASHRGRKGMGSRGNTDEGAQLGRTPAGGHAGSHTGEDQHWEELMEDDTWEVTPEQSP